MKKSLSRKLLSLILALCMVFSLAMPGVAAAANDISGHWAEETLSEWISLGLMSGDGNGVYRPNSSITRAEFFTLINRWKGYTAESDKVTQYTDVSADKWYYSAVAIAIGAGYVEGTSATTMAPENSITREEAMTIVARIAGIDAAYADTSILSKVSDGSKVSSWARGYVAAVINEGLIAGSDGKVAPLSNITRAETVVLLDRVRTDTRTYAFAGTYGPTSGEKTVKAVNIVAPGVILQNMKVTGDLTVAKSVGDGEATLNNIHIGGKLNVLGGGLNSIYLNNCTVKELIIEKDKVRVVLDNGSEISFVRMEGDDGIIDLRGNTKIDTVTVVGEDVTVKAGTNATIGTLNAEVDGTKIETQPGTKISTANLNGETTVTGTGTISVANINTDGCTLETKPTTTNVASGVTGTVAGETVSGSTGTGTGGGGGPSAPSFASHNVSSKTVPYGTQPGDLNLPASGVILTANTGATDTVSVSWNYSAYNPNAAGSNAITGTVSGATASWAPASITVSVTVQAALTVTGGTTIADVTVRSDAIESTAKAKLPSTLTLTLSDTSTILVSLSWTVNGTYTVGVTNTFTATIIELPANVTPPAAITASSVIAVSDTPVATTITLTANPGSVQRPASGSETIALTAVVTDQFGDVLASPPALIYELNENYGGINIGLDTGLTSSVQITSGIDAALEQIIVNVKVTSIPAVEASAVIYITDDPVIATSVEFTSSVSTMTIPVSGTATQQFTAVVKDQNGTVMSGEPVTWSIKESSATFASVSSGLVTVTDAAPNGATFTVVATSGSLTAEQLITLSKATSVATSISISGDSSIILPASAATAANTKTYTATIADQYGATMSGTVTWAIQGAPVTGVSITGGVLSVDKTATVSSATITATCGTANGTKTVSITKDTNKVPTTVTVNDGGPGNITLPASFPTTGADATRSFTATVKDQYGDTISSPSVTWSVSPMTGLTISNGTLTVTSAAAVGTVTITATSGTISGTTTVTIAKATPALAQITVIGPGSVDTTGTSSEYQASGKDQYGESISTGTVTWSIENVTPAEDSSNISIGTDGKVTTASASENTTFTVKATSGALNATAPVIVASPYMATGLKWSATPTTGTLAKEALWGIFTKPSTEPSNVSYRMNLYRDGSLVYNGVSMDLTRGSFALGDGICNGAGNYTFEVETWSGSTKMSTSARSPVMTVSAAAALTNTISASILGSTITVNYSPSVSGYFVFAYHLDGGNRMGGESRYFTSSTATDTLGTGGTAVASMKIHQLTNRAVNGDGSGSITVSVAKTVTVSDGSRVPQVTNLQFEMKNMWSTDYLLLSWTNPQDVSNIDGYHIEYSTDGGLTWTSWLRNSISGDSYQMLYNFGAAGNSYKFRVTNEANSSSSMSNSLPVTLDKTLSIVDGGSAVPINSVTTGENTMGGTKYLFVNANIGAVDGIDQYLMKYDMVINSSGGGTYQSSTNGVFKPAESANGILGLGTGAQSTSDTFESTQITVQRIMQVVEENGNATITLTPKQSPAYSYPVQQGGDGSDIASIAFETKTANNLSGWALGASAEIPTIQFDIPTNPGSFDSYFMRFKKDGESWSWNTSGVLNLGTREAREILSTVEYGEGTYRYAVVLTTDHAEPDDNDFIYDNVLTVEKSATDLTLTSGSYVFKRQDVTWSFYDVTLTGDFTAGRLYAVLFSQNNGTPAMCFAACTTAGKLVILDFASNAIGTAFDFKVFEFISLSQSGAADATLTYAESDEKELTLTEN